MIDTNDPKLIAAMRLMDARRQAVIRHCAAQQDLWALWRGANEIDTPAAWRNVLKHLTATMLFVTNNRRMFPNWERHIDQYDCLVAVAGIRLKMR